ncbi:MAG TPA: YncE family protein [Vicinamibacterales bacterium]|nr:YncE family protein [Vicinamibacterales bacterium]
MRKQIIIATALVALCTGLVARQSTYSQLADIPIGGPGPAQWDYSLADSAGKRLYVSHSTEVVVIDTAANKVVGRIMDTPGVHGIAVGAGRVFTSNGRENKVSVVDPKTLATLSKIDTGGANPDAITFDARRNEVWVFNHTGHSATQIDAKTGTVVATIPLTGVAETGQSDGAGRVFVNIEDKGQVDVIDIAAKKVTTSWPVAPGADPTGMAIDNNLHRLFVGAGPFMVMMDTTNGKVVASVPICSGTDATWYDAGTKLAFSSCRDGKVTIARVEGDKMTVVQTLDTSVGSRTMTLDSGTHRIYLTAAKPNTSGGRGYDPESFHVLVYGMK